VRARSSKHRKARRATMRAAGKLRSPARLRTTVAKWVKTTRDLKKRVLTENKGLYYHSHWPPNTGTGANVRRAFVPFDLGYRNWAFVGASMEPVYGVYNHLVSGIPNRNLFYMTPCLLQGDNEYERTGDTIQWRKTWVRLRVKHTENSGSSGSNYSPFKIRFVMFRFNANGPVYWPGTTPIQGLMQQFPTQEDFYETPFKELQDGAPLTEGALTTTYHNEQRRFTDKTKRISVIWQKTITLTSNVGQGAYNYNKLHNFSITPRKMDRTIRYTQDVEYPDPMYSTPLNGHYFLGAFASRPMKESTEQVPGGELLFNARIFYSFDR
jgi:hypothetical protein